MYKNFYGFKEKPFQIVPNPGYLYMSKKHENALTYLEYGIVEGAGFILLTGEIGTGKTTLIRHMLNQIEEEIEVAVVFNTNVTSDQLFDFIMREFELTPEKDNKAENMDRLNRFLINKYAEGKRVLLIIDEAQNLSVEALEEIRMISNLHTDEQMLLQIMLVGQPELRTNLKKPNLAQLAQRIAVNYHLSPLTLEETGQYIAYRLVKAGGKPGLFTPETIALIHQASNGIPRTINLICDSALVYGFADEIETIDKPLIEQVLKENEKIGFDDDAGDDIPAQSARAEGENNGMLLQRLESLEMDVRLLQKQVDSQMNELERKDKGHTDKLVVKLKRLLLMEQEKCKRLLVGYARLKEKYEALKESENSDVHMEH